jgi:transcriptional regulator with XRE-family HTH domain
VQTTTGYERRQDLGAFLRSRREAIDPESVGIPRGRRRLARGLRREEVASLSGIGVTWYTWLEQGRPVTVSSDALVRITKALRLTAEESVYLFALAEKRMMPPPELVIDVPAGLRSIIDSSSGLALALNARCDHLAWNEAAGRVYGFRKDDTWERLNHIVRMYADPERRALIGNWSAIAAASVAVLRSQYAQHGSDERFDAIFTALKSCDAFQHAWRETTVGRPPITPIGLATAAGPVALNSIELHSPALPGVIMFMQTPADERSAANLATLLARENANGRQGAGV